MRDPSSSSLSQVGHPWQDRVGRWLIGLSFVYGIVVSLSIRESSPTYDEGGHVVAGLTYVRRGEFSLYHHNPPLAKQLFGLAASDLDVRLAPSTQDSENSDWMRAHLTFLRDNRGVYLTLVNRARLVSLLFSILGALLCFAWARELFGEKGGFLALALFMAHPLLLAFAGLATPDMAATVLFLATFYCLRRFCLKPGMAETLLFGLVLGLAQLAKYSNLIAYPFAFAVLLGWRGGAWRRRLLLLGVALLLSVVVLNAGYSFQGTPTRLGSLQFRSSLLTGNPLVFDRSAFFAHYNGNRFAGSVLGDLPLPIPREFIRGFDDQTSHVEHRLPAYLLGTWQRGGWYSYYVIGFMVKTPLVILGLLVAAGWMFVRRRELRRAPGEELLLLLPALGTFALISSQTGINSHFRYVMASLPFLLIFAGRLGPDLWMWAARTRARAATSVLVLALPVAWVYPRQLSYFNLLAGGPNHGPSVLIDSNVDWGQDLVALNRWLARNRRGEPLYLYYFGTTPPSLYGINDYSTEDLPDLSTVSPGSLVAISVNILYGLDAFVFTATDRRAVRPRYLPLELRGREPIAKAGYSIYIYRL